MKEKYTTPEMEIVEFEEEACVTMSGGGNGGILPEAGNGDNDYDISGGGTDGGATWE